MNFTTTIEPYLAIIREFFSPTKIAVVGAAAIIGGGSYLVIDRIDDYPRTYEYNQTTIENKTDNAVHWLGHRVSYKDLCSLGDDLEWYPDTVKIAAEGRKWAKFHNEKWSHGLGYHEIIFANVVVRGNKPTAVAYNVGGRDNIKTFGSLLLLVHDSEPTNEQTWNTFKQRHEDLRAQGFNWTACRPHLDFKIDKGSYTECPSIWIMEAAKRDNFFYKPGHTKFWFRKDIGSNGTVIWRRTNK